MELQALLVKIHRQCPIVSLVDLIIIVNEILVGTFRSRAVRRKKDVFGPPRFILRNVILVELTLGLIVQRHTKPNLDTSGSEHVKVQVI
jgi:hypothetical protein